MTWCDKLASQPTIGFSLDPFYGGNETILTRLAPMLEQWGTVEKPEFSVEIPDIFRVEIQRENGFHYSFDAVKAAVQFQHRMKFRPVSGGLPVAELISIPQVFTSLLATATEELIDSTLLLPEAGRRHVRRVGIVSTTAIAEEDLPPGIQKFIAYMGRPWGGEVGPFNFSITANLKDDDLSQDRCIHSIVRQEDEESLLTIRFDWQRVLKKRPSITKRDLDRVCATAADDALRYFEDLAVGDAFDAID
ncbi:hypothetical protein ACC719_15700 [Rhizobium ruizarguesonis]